MSGIDPNMPGYIHIPKPQPPIPKPDKPVELIKTLAEQGEDLITNFEQDQKSWIAQADTISDIGRLFGKKATEAPQEAVRELAGRRIIPVTESQNLIVQRLREERQEAAKALKELNLAQFKAELKPALKKMRSLESKLADPSPRGWFAALFLGPKRDAQAEFDDLRTIAAQARTTVVSQRETFEQIQAQENSTLAALSLQFKTLTELEQDIERIDRQLQALDELQGKINQLNEADPRHPLQAQLLSDSTKIIIQLSTYKLHLIELKMQIARSAEKSDKNALPIQAKEQAAIYAKIKPGVQFALTNLSASIQENFSHLPLKSPSAFVQFFRNLFGLQKPLSPETPEYASKLKSLDLLHEMLGENPADIIQKLRPNPITEPYKAELP